MGDEEFDDDDRGRRVRRQVLAPEEVVRRRVSLDRLATDAIFVGILRQRLRRWGSDAVTEAVNAAYEEALHDPAFPADAAEMPAFLERIAERVAKRQQRGLRDRARSGLSLDEDEDGRIVAHARFAQEDDADDAERAREKVLDDAKANPAYTQALAMLYDLHVLRRSAKEVAQKHNVPLSTFYDITKKATRRLQRDASVAMLAVAFLVFMGVRGRNPPDQPVARHDDPTSFEEAVALLGEAQKECDGGEWARCQDLLQRAGAADPAIETRSTFINLRRQATEALAPKNLDKPWRPDASSDKAPKDPEKAPKAPALKRPNGEGGAP